MLIKVQDEELLEKTGGIIQGMSGCPVIQNGKFIRSSYECTNKWSNTRLCSIWRYNVKRDALISHLGTEFFWGFPLGDGVCRGI